MRPNQLRILLSESDGFSAQAADILRQLGELVLADLDRGGLLAAVGEADVLWVRLRNYIDTEIMAAAPSLKVIVTATTGLNHIDLEEAERRDIQVLSLRGEVEFLKEIRATAEHTLALMLSLLRHVPRATAHVRDGGWDRDQFKGRELHGKTVGIVGYGRLGRIVAHYLKAFNTRILAADPHLDTSAVESSVTFLPLTQLLQESELVTLHVNLCPETRGFFGREQFSAMKKGAWFINTSRGELVDETALLEVLRSRHLAGAALDVLCDEDASGMLYHPVVAYARTHDHLIITPHLGGCTTESMETTEVFLAEKLCYALATS